jgi:hypothetical protein
MTDRCVPVVIEVLKKIQEELKCTLAEALNVLEYVFKWEGRTA